MSDQLTQLPAGGRVLPAVRRMLLVLAVFVVAGALAGVLWEWVWTAPDGIVIDHEIRLDGDGLRADFSGTALYVLIGAVAGLLLGVGVAVFSDGHEVVTLAAVVLGSVIAAWVMLQVGLALGPPDPAPLARTAEDYTRIPDELHVEGRSPFTALPGGAMVGMIVVFVGLSRRPRHHD